MDYSSFTPPEAREFAEIQAAYTARDFAKLGQEIDKHKDDLVLIKFSDWLLTEDVSRDFAWNKRVVSKIVDTSPLVGKSLHILHGFILLGVANENHDMETIEQAGKNDTISKDAIARFSTWLSRSDIFSGDTQWKGQVISRLSANEPRVSLPLKQINQVFETLRNTPKVAGSTLLHEIVQTQDEEILRQFLTDHPASAKQALFTADANGNTPLHLAAMTGSAGMVTKLALLDPESARRLFALKNGDGKTPTGLAAARGALDIAAVGIMAQALPSKKMQRVIEDGYQNTPLHWAIRNDEYKALNAMIRIALKQAPDLIHVTRDGTTILHEEMKKSESDVGAIMEFIPDEGAKVRLLHVEGNFGSIFEELATAGNIEMIKALTEGMSQNALEQLYLKQDAQGDTVLHNLFFEKDNAGPFMLNIPQDIFRKMLVTPNRRGKTPLDIAVQNNLQEAIGVGKAAIGAGIMMQSLPYDKMKRIVTEGRAGTVLHWAAEQGDTAALTAMIRVALEEAPGFLEFNSGYGTFLDPVLRSPDRNLVKTVMQAIPNGELKVRLLLGRDQYMCTPLHRSTKWLHLAIEGLSDNETEQVLLAQDWSGDTPIHVAVRENSSNALVSIFHPSRNNDLKWKFLQPANRNQETPVHMAASSGMTLMAPIMGFRSLEEKINVCRLPDFAGRTPIHFAALNNNHTLLRTIAQQLPQNVVDQLVSTRDHAGHTPISLAAKNGNVAFVAEVLNPKLGNRGFGTQESVSLNEYGIKLDNLYTRIWPQGETFLLTAFRENQPFVRLFIGDESYSYLQQAMSGKEFTALELAKAIREYLPGALSREPIDPEEFEKLVRLPYLFGFPKIAATLSRDPGVGEKAREFYVKQEAARADIAKKARSKFKSGAQKAAQIGKGSATQMFKGGTGTWGRPLDEPYWLEALSMHKHYGGDLHPFFEAWKKTDTDLSFQDWFAKVNPALGTFESWIQNPESPAATLSQVTFLQTPEERAPYLVTWRDGKAYRGGVPYDTGNESARGQQGLAIFVIGPKGDFYSGSHTIGKFHHSSFLAGSSIIGAGEIQTDSTGAVTAIVNRSGHYKPGPEEMLHTLYVLERRGVDLSKVTLYMHMPQGVLTYNALEYLRSNGNCPPNAPP